MPTRKELKGLAEKMGLRVIPKDGTKRLTRKLVSACEEGIPEGLTKEEEDLVVEFMRGRTESEGGVDREEQTKDTEKMKEEQTEGAEKMKEGRISGVVAFRRMILKEEMVPREEVERRLREMGLKEGSIRSYISAAKAPVEDKSRNWIGIQVESVVKEDIKFLQLVV